MRFLFKPYVLFILFLTLMGAGAPVFAPNNPFTINVSRRLEAPSFDFWFGTDNLGRCVLSRIIHGIRVSLGLGVTIMIIALVTGIILGTLSGYMGGWVDEVLMRMTDIFMTIPSIIVALVLSRSLGPGVGNLILIFSLTMWTRYTRMVRGLVLEIKNEHYIETAKIAGFKTAYILLYHILPGILPPMLVMATLGVGMNILMVSSLSFLGLGIVEPIPDWGAMLNNGTVFLRTSPHLALFPGLFISLTVLSFNLLGDHLKTTTGQRKTMS